MNARILPKSRLLVALLLLAFAVGACGTDTPEATPTIIEPTSSPTARPPTKTPPPTATPLPLPAPQLLERRPAPGEEQPLDASIGLTFDQIMDQASVEAAFTISPTVQGSFAWADRTMGFRPSDTLERGVRYRVSIAESARNIEGEALEEPIAFEFDTVAYLGVSQVVPAPGSDELNPDTIVTVIFDRPVVPLATLSQQGENPHPLTFTPPVRGEGEWINTSIYQFHPEEGFLPATQYKGRVAAGLTSTSDAILDEDHTWEFSTARPAVLEVRPGHNAQHIGPTGVISVTFNQPMDHATVEFSVKADSRPVGGTYRWSGGDSAIAPETMIFIPDEPLPRDAEVVAQVSKDAQARAGNMGLLRDKTWAFATVKNPGVVSTSPEDSEEDVNPGGSVRITFASPMQRKGFMETLSIRPQVTKVYTYWSEYDTKVRIYFPQEPATSYQVSLDGETPDRYGAELGETASIRFTTGDLSPYATLATDGRLGTYGTYTETVLYARHRNVSRLEASLYRLDPDDFMSLNSDWRTWDQYQPSDSMLVHQWSVKTNAPRNEAGVARFDLTDDEGEALAPGLYYVELSAPEVRADRPDPKPSRYMFVKSGINLTLKQTRSEALVWATDLNSGEPVADLPVKLYLEGGRIGSNGATDAEGLWATDHLHIESLWDAFFAVAGQPGDDGFGIAYNGWDDGISPWSFDVPSEFWGSEYQGYVYTDRPIYRPGQTVYFKGILRTDDDARYSLPQGLDTLQVQVDDPQGKELYQEDLPMSDMGTLYDELQLDEGAPLGTYYVEVRDPERDIYSSTSFRVAEYRKPEFQVAVTTDRGAYLDGDTIGIASEATYYFGGAVADADVHWSVLSSDYGFHYECPRDQVCPWYSWSDFEWGAYDEEEYYGSYGHLVAEGDVQTDGQGQVIFEVPADTAQESQSQRFTIETSVTDVNGQQVSNRKAAIVHQGEFYIGVSPRGYLAGVGERKPVDLLTVDWDGEPVGDLPLTVTFMEHRWYSVRKQAENSGFYWDWVSEDIPVFTTTVTTDGEGQAVAAFAPKKAGSYRVRAIGHDSYENEIRSSAYFWVWGGSHVSWRQESNNRIELIADKEEYEVGDVAEILIPSPYSDTVQALVTIERGHIMDTEVRELETNSEVLRVPITEDHVPNVFLSVVIVQGAQEAPGGLASFKMGMVKLPVSLAAKELDISLVPDKDMDAGEHYGPRETATYDVLVTDHGGEPVEAELSLRLADLAVLALADEAGPTLMERFWRDRGLGVKTSTPLVVAMEPFNRELEAGAKGGGGGEDGGLLRSRFADTAFWDPVVRTDEDGRAQVSVQLPDNLTTWRMQARGITASTQVGRGEVDVVSTLELLVRPVLPRFFVVGDEAEIATIVHNNTAGALDVEVNISAEGLALGGAGSQRVSVPAGEKAKMTWPAEALAGDEVKVRMWASAGDLYDGREDTLPVYRYSTPEVTATSGQLPEPGQRQEIIQLPRTFDPTQGGLSVQIDGSLAAASQDALGYLAHYPYQCVEQTVSRFLPNVVTWQALDEMDVPQPELRQRLAQMVGSALQRLYAQQHYDDGWGWWVADESDPYLSAYVLQGMLEAYRAGFSVDEEVVDKAAGFLSDRLPSVGLVDTHSEANRLAYQLYVLAEYGDLVSPEEGKARETGGELGVAVRLFEKRHLLSQYGRATLAVALSLLEPGEPQRVKTLITDLAGDAVVSATGVHWEEESPDYLNMNTDIRTTAIVIWALSRLERELGDAVPGELLPNAVRWLMAMRREGYWETTQATAWSLLGLVEYMRLSSELDGDYSYSVYLNGEEWASGDVTKEDIDESQTLEVAIGHLLVEEGNRLVIERHEPQAGQSGEGQLYYSAHLRTYLPVEQVKALDRGISVARQYNAVDDPGTYVDSVQVGDVVRVKLTIIAPTDLHYVVVEDPLPAGFEGLDLSLNTSSVVGEQPELQRLTNAEENYRRGWGWWWFSHSELRDEKVALFATYLPQGTYEYAYLMRASVPGEFLVMPSTAFQMYFPEVFGRSDGGKFAVEAVE